MATQTEKLGGFVASCDVDAIQTIAGYPKLIVRCDGTVYCGGEGLLAEPTGLNNPLQIEPGPAWAVRAQGVEAFSCIAAERSIAVVRGPAVEVISLEAPRPGQPAPPPRRLDLPGLPGPIEQAHLGSDPDALLAVTLDLTDLDFARHEAIGVDWATRKAWVKDLVSSVRPLQCGWVEGLRSFGVLDAYAERLWQVRPDARARLLYDGRTQGVTPVEIAVSPRGNWILLAGESRRGRPALVCGTAAEGAVAWGRVTELDKGIYTHFRWHPTQRLLACEWHWKKGTALSVLTPEGEVRAQQILPRGWFSSQLCWSSTGKHLFALASPAIIAWRV